MLTQAIAGVIAIATATAWAQTAPPDAGSLMGTVKEPAQAPRKSPSFDVRQEVRPALNATSDFKVAVKGFRISGNTVFSEAELLLLVQGLAGKDLDLAALDQAAAEVSNYYRSNGYFVARAYLPAQEIKAGNVEIAVIEGRLGNITVKSGAGTRLYEQRAQQIVTAAAAPGQPITERNIERGLLLLNDLPGVNVKSTLVPGATPGTSDLVVEATEGSLLGSSFDIDNYGNRYTGRTRAGASVYINDPQGIGDQITLRAMSSGQGMDYMRGSYLAPLGTSGSKLGVALSGMNYKLGGDFAVLNPKGKATVASIFGLHPFIRSRGLNLYGNLGYDHKSIRDDMIPSFTEKRINVINTGLSGDSRDGFGGGGMWNYGATYVSGKLDITGNPTAINTDLVTVKTQGSYNKINYNVARLQRLNDSLSLYGAISGQSASKNLDTSEKFMLGGLGVRAYPVGEAPGDEGYLFNLEARYDVQGFALGNMQVLGFYDTGRVVLHRTLYTGWNGARLDFPNRYKLSGMGLGLNFYGSSSYSVRFSYAWKIGNNPARDINNRDSDNTNDNGRLWVQAVKWF